MLHPPLRLTLGTPMESLYFVAFETSLTKAQPNGKGDHLWLKLNCQRDVNLMLLFNGTAFGFQQTQD